MSEQRYHRPGYALVYAGILPVVQEIGRQHGYAIAVHGSMATDLDLLACPWVDDASEPEVLIEEIRQHLSCVFFERTVGQPQKKPHGRLAWSMQFDPESEVSVGGPYIDISVMPKGELSMSNFTINQGEYGGIEQFTEVLPETNPPDYTQGDWSLFASTRPQDTPIISALATLVSQTVGAGIVTLVFNYQFANGDTDTPGIYDQWLEGVATDGSWKRTIAVANALEIDAAPG